MGRTRRPSGHGSLSCLFSFRLRERVCIHCGRRLDGEIVFPARPSISASLTRPERAGPSFGRPLNFFRLSESNYFAWTPLSPATRNCMRVPDSSRRSPLRVLNIEFVPADDSAEADDPIRIWRTGVASPRLELAPSVFCVVAPTAPPALPRVDPAAPAVEPTAPTVEPTAPPAAPSNPRPPPPEGAATGAGIGASPMDSDSSACPLPLAANTEVSTAFN